MRKIDLPLAADTFFYTVCIWFLLAGIFRRMHLPAGVWISAALLLTLAFGALIALLLWNRHTKVRLKKEQTAAKEKLMLHLALEREERVRAALLEALIRDGRQAHCEKNALSLDGSPLIPVFTMEPVSADTIARLLREYGTASFTIACNLLSPEAERLLFSFSDQVMNGEDVYLLMERTQTLPQTYICGELKRKSIRKKMRKVFSKRNAYPFFVSGACLLVMSLFVVFPLYYLITGALLMSAAILIRAFGYT